MLDRRFVKFLDHQQCLEHQEDYQRGLDLTDRRLERLRHKQKQNPSWAAFDPFVGEVVDIGIRIEEQEAVKGELELSLTILQERLNYLIVKEQYPESKQVGKAAHQLSILDVVPCE